MGSIQVFLENGFEHDHVTVSVGGAKVEKSEVTTRYQVGLALVVELTVPDSGSVAMTIAVLNRGLTTETTINPEVTPYLRVNVADGLLVVQPEAVPPMFA